MDIGGYDYIFYTNIEAKPVIADFIDELRSFWTNCIVEVSTTDEIYKYDASALDDIDTPFWGLHIYKDEEMLNESEITGGALTAQGDSMIQLLTGTRSVHARKGLRAARKTKDYGKMIFVLNEVRSFTIVIDSDDASPFTEAILSRFTNCLLKHMPPANDLSIPYDISLGLIDW